MGKLKLTMSIVMVSILALFCGALNVWAQPPNSCMNDNWSAGTGRNQDLVCEAKEVFIAENPDGSKIIDAAVVGGDDCAFPGDTATVSIVADLHFNADRFDVGIYSAGDGGDAYYGACYVDVLPPNSDPGDLPLWDFDGDVCGDVDTPPSDYGASSNDFVDFTFQTMTLTCTDTDDDGFLDFGTCFSWRTKGNNDPCSGGADIYPGTKSKCFCERVNIPIPVPPPVMTVTKTPDPDRVNEPGDYVRFDVTMAAPSFEGNNTTITSITDDIYGDITTADGTIITETTCDQPSILNWNGDVVSCYFVALVEGNGGESQTDWVTVTGVDSVPAPNTHTLSDNDDATVNIVDVLPTISVDKTANPTIVGEGLGEEVTFSLVITNTSTADPLEITELTDDIYGDLNAIFAPSGDITVNGCYGIVGTVIPVGGNTSCSFTAVVDGPGNTFQTDTVTATGRDDEVIPNYVSASDPATVNIKDDEATIKVTKRVTPLCPPGTNIDGPGCLDEPGGNAIYYFIVKNLSTIDTVTIDTFNDVATNASHGQGLGDLNGQGDCSLPQVLAPLAEYSCSVPGVPLTGDAGDTAQNLATAVGHDDEPIPNEVSDSDDALVNFKDVPPSATLTKTVDKMLVTYNVQVCNDSAAESLELFNLIDDVYGNITLTGGKIDYTDCSVPQTLDPEGEVNDCYECTFDGWAETSPVLDTVTGSLEDNELNPIYPSDSAEVQWNNNPTP